MKDSLVALISFLGGGIFSYLAKSTFEYLISKRREKESLALAKRVDRLERQLSEFYWPIYLRLQKDNAVWEKILDRENGNDELRRSVGHDIEKNTILPNHDEIVRILEGKAHLVEPDSKLMVLIQKYLRHIAVYKSMRNSGCFDKDPIFLDEPWPKEFFPEIEKRTLLLQEEYNSYLRSF